MLHDHPATIRIDGVNLRVIRHKHGQPMSVGILDGESDSMPNAFSRLIQCGTFETHMLKIVVGLRIFNCR